MKTGPSILALTLVACTVALSSCSTLPPASSSMLARDLQRDLMSYTKTPVPVLVVQIEQERIKRSSVDHAYLESVSPACEQFARIHVHYRICPTEDISLERVDSFVGGSPFDPRSTLPAGSEHRMWSSGVIGFNKTSGKWCPPEYWQHNGYERVEQSPAGDSLKAAPEE